MNHTTLTNQYNQLKQSAEFKQIHFELTIEHLSSMPQECFYTGLPLTMELGKSATLTIDRLDNKKPYTHDNVVLCCDFIRKMKRNLDYGMFICACEQITTVAKSIIIADS